MKCHGIVALVALLGLAACQQGPGHTRAAGTLGGTALGAALGAAASAPGCSAEGALVGGLMGLVAGSMAGEAIAQDQEAACCPPVPCYEPAPPAGYVIFVPEGAPPPPGYAPYAPQSPPPPGYVAYVPVGR